jgi:hypothetical protein
MRLGALVMGEDNHQINNANPKWLRDKNMDHELSNKRSNKLKCESDKLWEFTETGHAITRKLHAARCINYTWLLLQQ